MSSNETTVVFRLVGTYADGGLVRLHQFNEFCKSIERVLKETDASLNDDGSPALQYRITDLKCESALLKIEAIAPKKGRDRRENVIGTVKNTCRQLQAGKMPDMRLTQKAIKAYREMGKPLSKGIGKSPEERQLIKVDGVELTTAFIVNIDQLSEHTSRSEGDISGRLERLDLHNKWEFVVFPAIGGGRVMCKFPESLLETVRAAIKKHVTVRGTMFYVDDNPIPIRAIVSEIIIHHPKESLATLSGLFGRAKSLTEDSVSLVRAIRDE